MVCYVVVNMVPYHAARLRAVARTGAFPVCALELRRHDPFRPLEFDGEHTGYQVHTVSPFPFARTSSSALRRAIWEALCALSPDVVCVNGWGLPGSVSIAEWCLVNRKPIILLSDSTEGDAPRNRLSEGTKSQIVKLCSAAVVAGSRHRDYLVKLGMTRNRIFLGYDVVDNGHFREGASKVRQHAESERRRLGLPSEYFLTCCRFGAVKNLTAVITAFAHYRALTEKPWALVLVGDGELRPAITALVQSLGLQESVALVGARGYGELPSYYGLAGCFVHASTKEPWGLVVNEAMAAGLPVLVSERCGCTPELVHEDVNGYAFDPMDTERMAHLMLRVAGDPDLRKRFGEASVSLISNWGLERFAAELAGAVRVCGEDGVRRSTLVDRALLRGLSYVR